MKTIAELNASKVPLVIIDSELNKLKGVILFPEKWKKQNRQSLGLGYQNGTAVKVEKPINKPDFIGRYSILV